MVTRARGSASRAYVLRQLVCSASVAGQRGEGGGGQAAGERDDGEGADAVTFPPACEGGEGGLVEGGGHGHVGQQPGSGEGREVGSVGDGQHADDAQDGAGGHHGARAAAVWVYYRVEPSVVAAMGQMLTAAAPRLTSTWREDQAVAALSFHSLPNSAASSSVSVLGPWMRIIVVSQGRRPLRFGVSATPTVTSPSGRPMRSATS